MARIGDDDTQRKKENVDFLNVNSMRKVLGLPLLEKRWVTCIGGCGNEFFSFDAKGNRVCDQCKGTYKESKYKTYTDTYSILGGIHE